jgi:hypothetical protein
MEESRGIPSTSPSSTVGSGSSLCVSLRATASDGGLTRDQVRARRRRRDTPVQGSDEAAGVRAADYYAYGHAVAPGR